MKKNLLICLGIVLGFLVLSYAFVPELLSGKIVNQSDISGWQGMSHEKLEWDKAHPDEPAAWTGAMFSGMPTTSIQSSTKGDWTQVLYNLLLTGKRPATYFFISLLGAFLLMLSLGISPLVAAGGAIAVTFCAYNVQIVQVGHNTKMQALAFLPWVFAAMVFTYRKATAEGGPKWALTALGAALFGLALSFQIKANHPQISYYLALMILIYVVVLFISLLRRKQSLKGFWIASALLLVLGLAGIGTNAIKLLPTWEYTPYSMRGGASSTEGTDGGKASKGLDIAYATAWSYGWEELPNLMIPNYNGGASSGPLSMNSETVQLLKRAGQPNLQQVRKHLPTYWGPQPFTAGPMYMGAVTVFLFILGLLYWKGREKWWAVAASLLAVLLALGSHFLWFTKLFFAIAPLYNKFRTVSMALVVLQFTLPVLGFLMLDGIVKSSSDGKLLRRQVLTAGGVTLGLMLLLALMQSAFGLFTGASDAGQPDILVDALAADRHSLLWGDTLRSLLLVLGSILLLLWGVGSEKHGRRLAAAGLVCVLVLADLFIVGKRYLGPDDFVTPKAFRSQFDQRPVDKMILADTDPSYRVLDLTVNVFNDSHPSYWHKNIGGYSPAKLQRYQEYIDARINKDLSVLSKAISGAKTVAEAEEALPYLESLASLNCRYIIVGEENAPLRYPYARGNAWFESGVGSVVLESYAPDRLEYAFESAEGGRAVFSEVYYPAGWVARLEDGSELPVGLYEGGTDSAGAVAGKLLRCIDLPAGSHHLVMSFEPASYARGEALSRACSILLILLVIGSVAVSVICKKE
jgi:hypothetical protein